MTPDEYEARLRDAVLCYYNALPCLSTAHDHGDGFSDDLDAYADWLRLRAVAESGCSKAWATLGRCFAGNPLVEVKGYCPPCRAVQRMAELLAAAEMTR